ncbi:histone H3.1 [Anaeramoeba flamelloides]|uniref:Histone H3.1 n=1 Tax=Anaeramoeba flamelloides TaxID=1746091 RepID=A0AAV7YWW2_9EUKA|nr:histone H3.1 [Anaeramoeba flamelloides]
MARTKRSTSSSIKNRKTKVKKTLQTAGKLRRRKTLTKSLREIKKMQQSTDLLIPKASFFRSVKAIAHSIRPDLRFQSAAVLALQEVTETFLVGVLGLANLAAIHSRRVTVMDKDLRLVTRIRHLHKPYHPIVDQNTYINSLFKLAKTPSLPIQNSCEDCKQVGGLFNTVSEMSKYTLLDLPVDSFNWNEHEKKIVKEYLNTMNITMGELYQSCLQDVTDKKFNKKEMPKYHWINKHTQICTKCWPNVFVELLYAWRSKIPNNHLPKDVTNRIDCWYGRNCRTQKHNLLHAQKLNHICEQTRW